MRRQLRIARPTKIALVALWAIVALFVLSDLGENARGDSYLVHLIPWNFMVGAILSGMILAMELMARLVKYFANLS